MKQGIRFSLITLLIIYLFISIFRISHVSEKEISWDVLGYYLYLPAVFIYDDPMLERIDWLEKINEERKLTGTLYMVSSNDEGEPMYFFLMGTSIFYLPFFIAGHNLAEPLGFQADGFSWPYQYALVIGCIFYTLIGLFYFRKNLLHFFSEGITSLVMLLIVFGTNYIQHLTIKNLEPVTLLFMLVNIILWFTIKWHETYKFKHLLPIGLGITLIGMIKPSEVMVVLLPLFWNIWNKETFKEKFKLLVHKWKHFAGVIGICFIVALPQLLYWWFKTGHLVYDSYKNPGVGLDLFSPHIFDVLFSYRKGWLLYTPLMFFSLVGFFFLYRNNRKNFLAITLYVTISFYIISSWTEWWYGAGFSSRPMITLYPLLGITLGYFLQYLQNSRKWIRISIAGIIFFFIFLNQFQWWQLRHYILNTYRTTKEYYWSTFLKTRVTTADKEKLLIYRDFSGDQYLSDPENYETELLTFLDFEETDNNMPQIDSSRSCYTLPVDQEFFEVIRMPFKALTNNYYVWIKASVDIRFPDDFEGVPPCLVMHLERHGGAYGYFAPSILPEKKGEWQHLEYEYLTPELRNEHDLFKCYIWKRSKCSFDVDNFKVEKLERKMKK